jgi:hypothetical protein
MFTVYKKIISPDSSPILGPASPNLAPTNVNVNNHTNEMEPFSLCTYCCSARTKKDSTIIVEENDNCNKKNEETMTVKPKYEFGHATHYTYGVTSPRLLCEFE